MVDTMDTTVRGVAGRPADVPTAQPRMADGVRLQGRLDGSGFSELRYLAVRGDGQVIHLSRLLYLVLVTLDGRRDSRAVADRVSQQYRRRIGADGVEFLIGARLLPLGLVRLPGVGSPAPDRAASGARPRPGRPAPRRARTRCSPSGCAGRCCPPPPPRSSAACSARCSSARWSARTLGAFVAADIWLFGTGALSAAAGQVVQSPNAMVTSLLLVLVSTFFHETGHATACRYGGGRPGAIGVGVYVLFPAFFTDVTDSYRLPRRARLRTDLGGVYFNAVSVVAAIVPVRRDGLRAARGRRLPHPHRDRAAAAAHRPPRRLLRPGGPRRRARPLRPGAARSCCRCSRGRSDPRGRRAAPAGPAHGAALGPGRGPAAGVPARRRHHPPAASRRRRGGDHPARRPRTSGSTSPTGSSRRRLSWSTSFSSSSRSPA